MTDDRLYRAIAAWGGKWPRELTSGVMFYDGLRITRAEFLKAAKGMA
jgi:hypothetical protein